jgi:hypothetical protein
MYVSQVDAVPKTNDGLIHGPRNCLSGRLGRVETFRVRSFPRQQTTDVCNDGHTGKRSISDCDKPVVLSLVGTERVVLRHAPLSNKGETFLYTLQPLIGILIQS